MGSRRTQGQQLLDLMSIDSAGMPTCRHHLLTGCDSLRNSSAHLAGMSLAICAGHLDCLVRRGCMHRSGSFFVVRAAERGNTLLGSPHKTPWGDPDLQGIWSNQTPTPLERPDALAGKTHVHRRGGGGIREDVARSSADDVRSMSADQRRVERDLAGNERKEKCRRAGARRWSWIRRMGRVPYTPEGQKRWDAVPKMGKPMLANVPEDRNAGGAVHDDGRSAGAESVLQQLFRDRAGTRLRRDRHRDDARDAHHPARFTTACRRRCPHVDW